MVLKKMVIFRPMAGQYFLCGMIVGVALGLLLMTRLSSIIIERPCYNLSLNTSTPKPKRICQSIVDLYDEVKVLCWVMTSPKTHKTKALHVRNTWGKRCNILLFMSSKKDPSLPSIALPGIDNKDHLWGKTKEAFKYVYKHYYDKADWFFKADDDTYAVMENMRYMLRDKNTSYPVYYGFRFKTWVLQGYMSGGAGYVLSKEALRRFIIESLPDPKKCRQSNVGVEDVEIGRCLQAVKVIPGDTRDREGKATFLPVFVAYVLASGTAGLDLDINNFLWQNQYYPMKKGMKCCSDYIITIHYSDARAMYLLEYLIYHVKHFGVPYYDTISDDNNTTTSSVSVKTKKFTKNVSTRAKRAAADYYK